MLENIKHYYFLLTNSLIGNIISCLNFSFPFQTAIKENTAAEHEITPTPQAIH